MSLIYLIKFEDLICIYIQFYKQYDEMILYKEEVKISSNNIKSYKEQQLQDSLIK